MYKSKHLYIQFLFVDKISSSLEGFVLLPFSFMLQAVNEVPTFSNFRKRLWKIELSFQEHYNTKVKQGEFLRFLI